MIRLLSLSLFLLCLRQILAQDAVPAEILQRTMILQTPTERGTTFTIDHKGKLYLVTARHVVAGLPTQNTSVQLLQNGRWLTENISKILFPPLASSDVAVLVTDETVKEPFSIQPARDPQGPTLGQQVWFLGYPMAEALRSHAPAKGGSGVIEYPFIKRATMSALVSDAPNPTVFFLDGFNNKGFSGGPVLFWDFGSHTYCLLSVVSGYRDENAQVLVNGQHMDTNILTNSGIIISWSIDAAIDAIEANEIAPSH
jgi:S1-C subfamily serine protease